MYPSLGREGLSSSYRQRSSHQPSRRSEVLLVTRLDVLNAELFYD